MTDHIQNYQFFSVSEDTCLIYVEKQIDIWGIVYYNIHPAVSPLTLELGWAMTMAKWETYVALLEKAIEDGNVQAVQEGGWTTCGLCRLNTKFKVGQRSEQEFITRTTDCDPCPIAIEVGADGCRYTPYEALEYMDEHEGVTHKDFLKVAKQELELLRAIYNNLSTEHLLVY